MNSLWHLIFTSLLIWLSAGIWTAIHTAGASRLEPHTFRCFTDEDDNCAWVVQSPASLPKLLKNNMHVVHHTLSQRSAQLRLFYMASHHYSSFAFTLLSLTVLLTWGYLQPALMFEPLECHNFSSTVCPIHKNILHKPICATGSRRSNLPSIESGLKERQGLTAGQLQSWLNPV